MRLHVGERLPGAGLSDHAGAYVVTGVATETPWYGLYTAKKIFCNFDFTAKRPRPTDENEWLDVFLRTIHYPRLDDPDYVAERRARARAEARRILANRTSNLWPEPIDLLEIPNTRDPFTFAPSAQEHAGTEPVLVFARPQGEPLARWIQNVQPLSWVLGVLAELLEFIRAAHGDGLLLNGLGPGAVLIDRVGRVHYLGTDMVLERTPGTHLGPGPESGPAVDWVRHFPPERYPRGFSAPECFDPARPRDRRTDLYGWASIAYFLLTGDRPAQLALNQGQPWALFQDAQFVRLDRALRSVPPVHVRNWAEQLGVDSAALVEGWPGNLRAVLQQCLRPDLRQRPASVADLRAWLTVPPPPPVPAALAMRAAPDQPIKILIDVRTVVPNTRIMVRRGIGFQPITPEEGELVVESAPLPVVVDEGWMMPLIEGSRPAHRAAGLSLHYAVFTRVTTENRESFSVAAAADVIEVRPADIRRYAEGDAAPGSTDEPEPSRIRLLYEVFDPVDLAEILLASPLPQVRHWAIMRLTRAPRTEAAQDLLWRTLQDAVPAIRLESARGILEGGARPSLILVRRVVDALGGGDTDESIRAARSLLQIGVAGDVVGDTVAALERDRPTVCPECGLHLPIGDRPEHLTSAHGYVDVFGSLLPRPEGLARLWNRTFTQADRPAHERICQLLGAAGRSSTGDRPAYVAALEAELKRRGDELLSARLQHLPRLVECLRSAPAARAWFPHLIASADPRVREIGRSLLLPELAQQLAGDAISARDVRRELDRLGPAQLLEEKIQLCLQLAHVGVDAAAAEACLRELQSERLVTCPQCGATVTMANLDTHLRRAHHIYQFRGVRRSLPDTLVFLRSAVCGPSPDYEAWTVLERIAREEHPNEADAFLLGQVREALGPLPAAQQSQGIPVVAEAVVAGGSGVRLALALTKAAAPTEASMPFAHLALAVGARLPVPLSHAVVDALRPLLSVKKVPAEVRLEAAAAMLRTVGKAGHPAREILDALVAGSGKARAIDRLRELEKRVGPSPLIDELCAHLEDQVRMVCPRCSVQMRRPAMRDHLWEKHRLVLDGRRVREPWRVIEDWLSDYQMERDAAVLEQCRTLAQRLDADRGLLRLYRLILAQRIDDAEARRELLAEARRQQQSLCPDCYTLVPPREEPGPAEMSIWRGRISARGYRVEVSDSGLAAWMEVETPARLLYRGTEPPPRLTPRGALLVLAGIPACAALILSLLLPLFGVPALLPVAAALTLALALGLFVSFLWREPRKPLDRAIDYAWELLVPRLHAESLALEDSAFAAGLARASAGRGRAEVRAEALKQLRQQTETAVASAHGPVRHLAALWRLTAEDLARAGSDPVPLLVAQAGRCVDGKLPLSFIGEILHDWDAPWWTTGRRARLRVLLCDRAFEAGLEVQDLMEIGRVTSSLGAALKTDDTEGLAHLRLLWSLRPNRPWDRFGKTATVFEQAADAETSETRLAKYPDLLFTVEENPIMHVCVRGVVVQEEIFTAPPRTIEVVSRQLLLQAGHELILDERSFFLPDDPEPVARRLERLFRYFFHEFRGLVPAVSRWRSPAVSRTLRAQNAVPCPQCRQPVLVRRGEVGIGMEVAPDLEPPARSPAKPAEVSGS
jgi:hypothetical protein